jgi:hypothetical protein
MNDWLFESPDEQIGRLQTELAAAQEKLAEVEDELAEQLAEVAVFEREFEARVGHLVDELATIESQLEHYLERIQLRREDKTFGSGYIPVEEQFRQRWTKPPPSATKAKPKSKPKPEPVQMEVAAMKKLYRTLTKQYHPDLAEDDEDRTYRTEMMVMVNDAYKAQDAAALQKLVSDLESRQFQQRPAPEPELSPQEVIKKLKEELHRTEHRLQKVRYTLQSLHNESSVRLSLEVKLARRRGRDLLVEMSENLKKKIARKTVERDMIKAQFDSLR